MKRWLNSIRNLPRNLRTLRPFCSGDIDPYLWGLGVMLCVDVAPGDARYPLHFDIISLSIFLGPVWAQVGITDTG